MLATSESSSLVSPTFDGADESDDEGACRNADDVAKVEMSEVSSFPSASLGHFRSTVAEDEVLIQS